MTKKLRNIEPTWSDLFLKKKETCIIRGVARIFKEGGRN